MNLQGDKAFARYVVDQVRDRRSIHPRANRRADRLDTEAVPLAHLVHAARARIEWPRIQPTAPLLVVERAAPIALGWIDIDLITEYAAFVVLRVDRAANLHAAVCGPAILPHVEL